MAHIKKQPICSATFTGQSLARLLVLCTSGLLFCFSDLGHAQTSPITPSGLNTQVSDPVILPAGQIQHDITGGTRPGGGGNLFHSFEDFSVPTNNIANFLNVGSVDLNGNVLDSNLPTSNILGRVTGGDPSAIFGMIQINGPNGFGTANLFLMNPAGFLFGRNATMNVGGMVTFTTADYLRLSNGTNNGYFYADPAGPSLLTAAPVTAFGFLGSNAASIAIQGGTLEVPDGKTLAFIGGPRTFTTNTGVTVPADVTMTGGSLSAPNGLIYLATVTSPGEIPVPALSGSPLGPLGPPSSDPAIIRIRSGEFVMDHAFLTATNTSDAAQTAIEVNVQGAMALRNASSISTETFGAGQGSDVHITAQSLQMDGSSIKSTTTADGPGGKIWIGGQTVSLTNGAQIVSGTTGTSAGGNITITAIDDFSISGYDSTGTLNGITSIQFFDPNTGLPLVTSGVFSTTSGNKSGGLVTINAGTATLDNTGTLASITSGDGPGGDLTLNVRNLDIHNAGSILSVAGLDLTTFESKGNGRGGDITVTAQDSIQIFGSNPNFFSTGGITSFSSNTGDSGNITLSARNVSIENGGVIQSFGGGAGNAGNIAIAAEQVSVSGVDDFGNLSQISSSAAAISGTIIITAKSVNVSDLGSINTAGNGGDITIQAEQSVNVTGAGLISSLGGDSLSGDITISADQVLVSGENDFSQSSIWTSNGGQADVGKINLNVRELVVTDGGRINTETSGGNVLGGINIAATNSVTVSDGGKIRMENVAGAIEINATSITLDQGIIQTESLSENAGSVTLHADNLTLAGGFINTKVSQNVPGRGGDVTITVTDTVSISGRFDGNTVGDNPRPAGIYADTSGTLQGGNISVTAGNLISLSSPGAGLFSQSLGSSGNGGVISVQAPQIQLSDGAMISAKTTGAGDAGNVTVQGLASPAQSVLIDGPGSGIFTDTQGTGAGGNILIETSQSTTLTNGAAVSASSTGTMDDAGDAGMVTIHAGNTFFMQNSSVTTQATKSGGGQIEINAANLFRLVNSRVSSSVLDGTGGGGDISIDPNLVVLQNSQVIAQAVQGAGGNITITTPQFFYDQSSLVSATSQFGLNGTVTIQSPTSNLSGSVGTLPSNPSQAQSLLTQRCAALANGQASSFVVAGREQLPADPGGWLTSPLYASGVGEGQGVRGKGLEGLSTNEGREADTQILSLRRLTPSGFLIANFADSEATGCHS